MENRSDEFIFQKQITDITKQDSQESGQILWEADFFQITREGQELLQKVANSASL